MKRENLIHSSSVLFAFLVALGCEGGQDLNEDMAAASDTIIRGEDIALADSQRSGVVNLTSGCSGTLLNERWVLTANHCLSAVIDANDDRVGDNPSVIVVGIGNSDSGRLDIPASRVMRHPNSDLFGSWRGTDVALVQLSSSVPIWYHPSWWSLGRAAIYPGTASSVLGAEVTNAGYGCNAETYSDGNGNTIYPGYGFLRRSRMTVTAATDGRMSVSSEEGQGLSCPGDSGGPVFLDEFGPARTRYIVGVQSTSNPSPNGSSSGPPSQAFRDWVETTAFGSAPAASLSCNETTCTTVPNYLINNIKVTTAYAPFGAKQSECYDATATYNFENGYDFVTLGGQRFTGRGTTALHVCGILPVVIDTDYSVQSPGLTLVASNHTQAYECLVNMASGTSNCSGAVAVSQSSGRARVDMNMTGSRRLYVSTEICDPQGWVLNIGDSSCNNGGGGDCGSFSNDSELDIVGTDLRVFGRDGTSPSLVSEDATFLAPTNCTWRNFQISDGIIDIPDRSRTLQSANLLRINQPETEGTTNANWYIGINRVIDNYSATSGGRNGSGVRRVLLRLEP